ARLGPWIRSPFGEAMRIVSSRRSPPSERTLQWRGSRRSAIRTKSLRNITPSWTPSLRAAAPFRGRSRCSCTVQSWPAVSPISVHSCVSRALSICGLEFAAMTVAREFEAVYVWGAQTGGARLLGVPEATITAIRENHSRGVPPEDAQIIDFTRTLLRHHRVGDATFKAMQTRFGNDELVQLTPALG